MRFPHLLVSGLVYAVVGVLVVYVAISLIAGTQRTAEAPITVDSLLPAQSAGRSGPIAGWSVTYRFQAADGRTIVDEAFRTWDPDVIRAAKACYEPGNPDNHELVQPTIACPR